MKIINKLKAFFQKINEILNMLLEDSIVAAEAVRIKSQDTKTHKD